MAKAAKKKAVAAGGRNPDRRNGKAWKKPKPTKNAPTPERQAKDELIRYERARKREEGMARRAAHLAAMEELKEQQKNEPASDYDVGEYRKALKKVLANA